MRTAIPRLRTSIVALALAAVLAAPAVAAAAAPFSGVPGPAGSSTTAQTTTTATATTAAPITIPTTTSGDGLPTYAYILIGAVVVILFASITYWIRRDAHLHAPRHATRTIDRGRGTVAPVTERRKRSRAKGKAARRARRPRRN
jgi:hypothetical protein